MSQPEMDIGARLGVTWLNLDLVPIAVSSVLSFFIFNLLSPIHSATSSIQSFKQKARTGKSEGTLHLWSWESRAKKWYERPDWQITALKGCGYRVNRRGPRTEPWGTPHFRTDGADSWPTNTDWVRQLKQEINESRAVPEQPKVSCNIVIRMLWSVVTKQTHNHCLKPEADHLLHATRWSQCCDTFGRQTGTALEGKCCKNCFKTIRSSTFDKNGQSETGR